MSIGAPGTMPIAWSDWLFFQHFYREAKSLLEQSPPAEDTRLTAMRDRAWAAVTQGDANRFHIAGRQHATKQNWSEAAEAFARVVDNLPAGFRPGSREMHFCLEIVQLAGSSYMNDWLGVQVLLPEAKRLCDGHNADEQLDD